MSCLGISYKFLNILISLYENTQSTVWDGHQMSEWFNTNSGVKQGCILSALIFSIFINDIVDSLPGGICIAETTVKALLYADDVVIFAESPKTLQLMINRVSDFCKKWTLINIQKSKIMIFRNGGGRYGSEEKWFYNGEEVEVVKQFKYLGVTITSNMNFNKHLQDKCKAALSLVNASWKNIMSNKNILLSTKFQVFNSVVRSSLCYAAQVWGCYLYESLEKALRIFIKKIFCLPSNVPNYAIYLESGLTLLRNYTLKLQASYILKTMSLGENKLAKKLIQYEMRYCHFWGKEWKNLGQKCGYDLTLHPVREVTSLQNSFFTIMEGLDEMQRNEFILQAKNSSSRVLYSELNYNLCSFNYFKDYFSYKKISLLFRLRSETLLLNGSPYSANVNQFCSMCNLNQKEDCFHFTSICPVFGRIREMYFGHKTLSMEQTKNILNGLDWNTLNNYSVEAYKYRLLILNEFS